MSEKFKDPLLWLRGLFAALIYGASSAGAGWLGMTAVKAAGVDVPTLNFKSLGVIMLTSGLVSVFAYLQKSPLPEVIIETRETSFSSKNAAGVEISQDSKTVTTTPVPENKT